MTLIAFSACSSAHQLYCGTTDFQKTVANNSLIDAYYSPEHLVDSSELVGIAKRLQHVDVISYGFGSIESNRLTLTKTDKHNIKLLNRWRYNHLRSNGEPEFALVLSIGGWGGRFSFTPFLSDASKLDSFVQSANQLVSDMEIDGIDVDWENVSITSKIEQKGVSALMHQLKSQLPSGACISNAVPATPFYWKQYPSAEQWGKDVDWSVVMGYDLYGTFGPFTEIASNLHKVKVGSIPTSKYQYNYPESVSVSKALNHYHNQGLPASKLIMGVPFYCHSYFTDSNRNGGLRQPVYDANISSQIPIGQALALWKQGKVSKLNDDSSYSLIPIQGARGTARFQFLSCETPESISKKVQYTKQQGLAGVSMWELSQDVNYDSSDSLLHAMTNTKKENH